MVWRLAVGFGISAPESAQCILPSAGCEISNLEFVISLQTIAAIITLLIIQFCLNYILCSSLLSATFFPLKVKLISYVLFLL